MHQVGQANYEIKSNPCWYAQGLNNLYRDSQKVLFLVKIIWFKGMLIFHQGLLFCLSSKETIVHLMRNCSVAQQVWHDFREGEVATDCGLSRLDPLYFSFLWYEALCITIFCLPVYLMSKAIHSWIIASCKYLEHLKSILWKFMKYMGVLGLIY